MELGQRGRQFLVSMCSPAAQPIRVWKRKRFREEVCRGAAGGSITYKKPSGVVVTTSHPQVAGHTRVYDV